MFTLPAPLGPLVGPNPFHNSLLSFCLVVAKLSSFVAVFPTSFPDDGDYFLASLSGGKGVVRLAKSNTICSIGVLLSQMMIQRVSFMIEATMYSVVVTVILHRCAHLVCRAVVGGSQVGGQTCYLVFG